MSLLFGCWHHRSSLQQSAVPPLRQWQQSFLHCDNTVFSDDNAVSMAVFLMPCSCYHYSDVIMSAMAYQNTSLTVVCSTVYAKKTPKLRVIGPATRKIFPFDDVIMTHLFRTWKATICHSSRQTTGPALLDVENWHANFRKVGSGCSAGHSPSSCKSTGHLNEKTYRQTSNISCTKLPNLNVSRLVLQLSLQNTLKPCVKSRMKM